MLKRGSLIALGALVLVLLIGCMPAEPTATRGSSTPTNSPSTSSGVTAMPTSTPTRLSFEKIPCLFAALDTQTVECGYVTVPEDHFNLSSRTILLLVAVFRNKSADRQPDPLIMLCGGPGEKCFENAPTVAARFAPLMGGRDLVVFDQRGVGRSQPALDCPEWEQAYLDTLAEKNVKVQSQVMFDALKTCHDRFVQDGYNLSLYNTTQNAADVNDLRAALGYQQVNLYGASYGSLLAQAIMRDYPTIVRSAVVDSVLPLETSAYVDLPVSSSAAILRLVQACMADTKCNATYPNLKDVLFKTIERLNAQPASLSITDPASGKKYQAVLTGDGLVDDLTFFLYVTDILPMLPQTIYDVSNGKYDLIAKLSSLRLAELPMISRGMNLSVMCAEDLINRTLEDLKAAIATVPPQLAGDTDPKTIDQYGPFAMCKNWSVKQADPSVKKPLVSDIPTLVLSGEFDPVTPASNGRLLASHLSKSVFFEFPGVGHSVGMADDCALSIVRSFLDHPTASPDAVCIAKLKGLSFDPSSSKPREVKLVPFTSEALGVSGLLPEGWQQIMARTYARQTSAIDPTALVINVASAPANQLLSVFSNQMGFDQKGPMKAIGQSNGLLWSAYSFTLKGYAADFAITESGGQSYYVLMISDPEEHAALYDRVFEPVVRSLKIK